MDGVFIYSAVRTESLNVIQVNLHFYTVKKLCASERSVSNVHFSSKITLFRFNTLNKNNTDLTIIIIII
jgi:hypothetical protein